MSLSEEEANLATYSLQLQQVEAALTNDPSNPELTKLKSDLEEVINLTKELIDTTKASSSSNHKNNDGSDFSNGAKRGQHHYSDDEDSFQPKKSKIVNTNESNGSADKVPSSLYGGEGEDEDFHLQFHEIKWEPGMQCYAPWSKDGKLNAATIKEVSGDKQTVTVSFDGYGIVEKCTTGRLKHPKQVSDFIKQRSKRSMMEMQREKKKKKNQNRVQKLKELDETKEQEKKSWKSFMGKTNKKGINKNSIFKSSDETKFAGGKNYNAGGDCPISKGMSSRF
ncbi:survival of motor neuron-related-splicing factor 30-like [Symsagittifera roscoffensis]|uniref:survival of motor neuron-related-splicing factor 30-like n=1 Tax=Symsagittifera roscoffensis TaxID=84072 RepID=UPI00307C7D51